MIYFRVWKFNVLKFRRKKAITSRFIGSNNSGWNIGIFPLSDVKMTILPAWLAACVCVCLGAGGVAGSLPGGRGI